MNTSTRVAGVARLVSHTPINDLLIAEFGWRPPDEPGPQTEDSIERGFRAPGPVDNEFGRSESIDPDDVGEIADEGTGHRG